MRLIESVGPLVPKEALKAQAQRTDIAMNASTYHLRNKTVMPDELNFKDMETAESRFALALLPYGNVRGTSWT